MRCNLDIIEFVSDRIGVTSYAESNSDLSLTSKNPIKRRFGGLISIVFVPFKQGGTESPMQGNV